MFNKPTFEIISTSYIFMSINYITYHIYTGKFLCTIYLIKLQGNHALY
nr:MAG TPA: hypothetical protein [Crassvirales sp.]